MDKEADSSCRAAVRTRVVGGAPAFMALGIMTSAKRTHDEGDDALESAVLLGLDGVNSRVCGGK